MGGTQRGRWVEVAGTDAGAANTSSRLESWSVATLWNQDVFGAACLDFVTLAQKCLD